MWPTQHRCFSCYFLSLAPSCILRGGSRQTLSNLGCQYDTAAVKVNPGLPTSIRVRGSMENRSKQSILVEKILNLDENRQREITVFAVFFLVSFYSCDVVIASKL
jgi:hypothetical protein